jgi:hypothetical protein
MFSKSENLKHYQKIADGIIKVNPSYEVTILRKSHFDDGAEKLTIRATLSENRMSEFWIEDGYWVFADGSYQKGDWVLHGSRYPLDRFGLTMENHMLPPIDENLLPLFPQNSHWQNVVNAMFQVSSLATRDEENEYKEKGLL